MSDPVELLLRAPASVALFAALEREHRSDIGPFDPITDIDPAATSQAVAWLRSASLPDLIVELLRAAQEWAGPWSSGTSHLLPAAYSTRRISLATALVDEFAELLRTPIDREAQEFWTSRYVQERRPANQPGVDLDRVYCCGEFPTDGHWTTTSPHLATHESLATAWELDVGGVTDVLRWRQSIPLGARVYEIHEPEDWAGLVERYPVLPAPPHWGWELPGPNHETMIDDPPVEDTALEYSSEPVDQPSTFRYAPYPKRRGTTGPGPVEAGSFGHAARRDVAVAMPDWTRVAREYDGVHLSWSGMLTCEGHVIDLPNLGPNVVTMLRYWFAERTLWLNPVLGEPEPLPSPFPSDE